MYRQHAKRKPDFFAVLVLLVLVSFGATVMLQLMTSNLESTTVSHPVTQPPVKTFQARS
jgi:hypothetical protein